MAKGGERFRNLDWQRRANGSSPRPFDHPMPGLKTHRAILGGEQGCPKKITTYKNRVIPKNPGWITSFPTEKEPILEAPHGNQGTETPEFALDHHAGHHSVKEQGNAVDTRCRWFLKWT